ncbi:MAG TPA: alpha/beta hydrolase, partial [Synergistales bacterium]|nr:alpha/beta hydrolase [Synergistales bacterium]
MVLRRSIILLICLALATSAPLPAEAETPWPQVAFSADGVPISFEVHGDGEPALVFVHGWSCDARYWSAQTPLFSLKHRVIILDLAGHGHSGMGRSKYTMGSFGEDVRAVVEATDTKKAILVGHS